MKKTITTLLLLAASAAVAAAQAPNGSAREAVSSLPESQAILYVNARRILNDALPRVLPQATLDKAFADLQKNVNVDPRSIEYVILGVRYGESLQAGTMPDFGVSVRGGFNADALLSMLRMVQAGQYRPETYGGKTLDVYKIDFEGGKSDADKDAAAPASPPAGAAAAPLKLPTEFAIVSLGADELLLGTPAYVRSAIDARGGSGGRVRADLVDLALRNPDALLSTAGDLPPGMSKYFDMATGVAGVGGMPTGATNDEIRRLADSLRQMQMSVNMTQTEFGVQAILRTEKPEDARALSGLVALGVGAAERDIVKDLAPAKSAKQKAGARNALAVLKSLVNTARDNELTLSLGVAQSTIADLVKQATAKPAPQRRTTTPQRRGRARAAARRR